ncbi:S8 family serine peptidase [Ulvibacterium marinum]|uniref:S8 family serine peptidase n=1 Tax=Ulvibacterium marinum TaxID=2419782 RepID=UPI0024952AB6|nr:S8 family serine peptidase [Ulvibacterium marinum]
MSSPLEKFDSELTEIYLNYLARKDKKSDSSIEIHPALQNSKVLSLQLQFKGDLANLESLGFQTNWSKDWGLGHGYVDIENLEVIADSDQVLRLEYGTTDDLLLDTSVEEILARGNPPPPPQFIWSVVPNTGVFTGNTGEDVIIGIIDSGIDFLHPIFFKSTSPNTTRILRIWDPGLVPQGGESGPDAGLLLSPHTYGVEYNENQINDILRQVNNAPAVRHRDCNSHGTHVASIAAGDGRATATAIAPNPFEFVGVAPKASIVVVKIFSLENNPRTPHPANALIPFQQRFKDAVTYIKNVVRQELGDKPVVINYSGGTSLGPHDGLTADESWLGGEFGNLQGKIFVTGSGNSAGRSNNCVHNTPSLPKNQHITITIPAAGLIEVPFTLYDNRVVRTDRKKCISTTNTKSLSVDVWYPDIGPNTLNVSLRLQGSNNFIGPIGLGANQSGTFDGNKSFIINHQVVPAAVPQPNNFNRNQIKLTIKASTNNHMHRTGTYVLKFTGPANTVLNAWCYRASCHGLQPTLPLPSGVQATEEGTCGSPGAAGNVITVAAYNDVSGNLASFSSKGSLVDYSGSGPARNKPDIAAPGVAIKAGESSHRTSNGPFLAELLGFSYMEKQGTSMASPHVAGLIAILLKQNPNLNTPQVLQLLRNHARPVVPSNPNGFGSGKLNAQESLSNVPPNP